MAYGQSRETAAHATELVGTFEHQLRHCRLRDDERLLVVTDTAFHPHYAAACLGAGLRLGADAVELVLPHGRRGSEAYLAAAFEPADLIVYSTTHALHYADAMRRALADGKRALMAVTALHVLERRIADPDVIARTKRGAAMIDRARTIRITSEAGTDLTFDKGDRPGVASYGVADEPGHLDFWGAGFFQTAAIEGTAEGRLVLDVGDQIFHFGRFVERPVTIEFCNGRAVSIDGGADAFLIRSLLASYRDPNAYLLGHIACGTDPNARWTAEIEQFPVVGGGGADAEAFYGNVQAEIGSNNDAMFGGQNATGAHLGLCSLGCRLELDGRPILEGGEFIVPELRADRGSRNGEE